MKDDDFFPRPLVLFKVGDRVEIAQKIFITESLSCKYGTIREIDMPNTCGDCRDKICHGHTKIELDDGHIIQKCFGYSPDWGFRVIQSDFITEWDDAK